MAYLYETHMHTCQGSRCGRSSGREHAQLYKTLGYQGIIVTDHFYGGNTAPSRELPWEEYVEAFCSGYEEAKAEGDRIGLDVFFGWEQGYQGDEYLVYGLDKAWLLAHPEIKTCSRARQLELVHEGGGCVVQAHPFRLRLSYMKNIKLGKDYCDGIEACNAGNNAVDDICAVNYAREYGFTMLAGSDNHNSMTTAGRPKYGILLEKRMESLSELVDLVRGGRDIRMAVPPERLSAPFETLPELETYWLNENEEIVPTGRDWRRPAR